MALPMPDAAPVMSTRRFVMERSCADVRMILSLFLEAFPSDGMIACSPHDAPSILRFFVTGRSRFGEKVSHHTAAFLQFHDCFLSLLIGATCDHIVTTSISASDGIVRRICYY
jgi:hypothetical protein